MTVLGSKQISEVHIINKHTAVLNKFRTPCIKRKGRIYTEQYLLAEFIDSEMGAGVSYSQLYLR